MLGFGMCIVENIDVVAPDSATFVFCGIYDAVDHDFGAVGYHRRVDCNGMPGSSHGACTGMTAPAAGTAFAGTVAVVLKIPRERTEEEALESASFFTASGFP